MRIERTVLPEVLLLEPALHEDARGFLYEHYQAERYAAHGISGPFVQDNVSFSRAGVLRGLHLQQPRPQAKLVAALTGAIWDVAVDVRRGSPRFGRWTASLLSGANRRQLYVPRGFAHGFCVLADALVLYKCDDLYDPAAALSVAALDASLSIDWPVPDPLLSPGDRAAARLGDLDPARLPVYSGDT